MPSELEYKINDILIVKLEDGQTYIYVKNKRFLQCIRLILDIEKDN